MNNDVIIPIFSVFRLSRDYYLVLSLVIQTVSGLVLEKIQRDVIGFERCLQIKPSNFYFFLVFSFFGTDREIYPTN